MKLELKHLAPYLPYGLMFYYEALDGTPALPWKLTPNTMDGAIFYQNKPILRPLSDLFTKRFDEENGGLRHIDIISSKIFFDNYVDDESTHEAFWSKLINSQIYPTLNQSKQLIDFLYKNHYDTEATFNYGNGLIDAGLAIDINTLK